MLERYKHSVYSNWAEQANWLPSHDVGCRLGLSLYLVSHSQETFFTWKSKNFKRIKTKTQDPLMPQHRSTTILLQPHFISQSKYEQPRLKWDLWVDGSER